MNKSSFGFKKPELSPGFMLWQTTTIWQRKIKAAIDSYGISHSQFVIMATLLWFNEQGHETSQVDIINMTKLDKMTVSKAIKKLVNEKLIARKEHSKDTRAKSVTLTDNGKSLVQKLIPIVEGIDHEFFGVIKGSEQKELIKHLNLLTN
jgi:DNA-binding MarR family transcriptional regulator